MSHHTIRDCTILNPADAALGRRRAVHHALNLGAAGRRLPHTLFVEFHDEPGEPQRGRFSTVTFRFADADARDSLADALAEMAVTRAFFAYDDGELAHAWSASGL